jgi:hypothetical protein
MPEMNFAICYLTRYEYAAEVVDNLNALRVQPAANRQQRCGERLDHSDPASVARA